MAGSHKHDWSWRAAIEHDGKVWLVFQCLDCESYDVATENN